jgi:hypothetical protein
MDGWMNLRQLKGQYYTYVTKNPFGSNLVQYRPVIRKPDIRKSGYKKGTGRVPANLLFIT